ncbi:hypothetical protein D4909_00050 [Listeria monocytogenes]|nr:hypothetical protein [Listeria monocytogenes]
MTPKTPYDIVNKVIKQERRSNPLLASLTRTFSGKKFKFSSRSLRDFECAGLLKSSPFFYGLRTNELAGRRFEQLFSILL